MTGFTLWKCSDVMLRYSLHFKYQIYFKSSLSISIIDNLYHLNMVSVFEMNIRVMNNATEHSDKYPNLMYKNLKAFNTFMNP